MNFNHEFKLFELHCIQEAKENMDGDENFSESSIKMAVFDAIKYVIRNRTLDQ